MLLTTNFYVSFLVLAARVSHALVAGVVTPRANAVDCPPNGFLLTLSRKCIPYVQGKTIAGISFSLYTFTADNAPTAPVADAKYLEPLQNATERILPVYADLMQTKLKTIRIYLSDEQGDRGKTDFREADQSVCSVQVSGFGLDQKNGDILSVQQALAHELYHCVQRTYGMDQPVQDATTLPNNWWFEGSAEYFGNVFYPGSKPDHMQSYNPHRQLFFQKEPSLGYGASLFWQHLSNTGVADKDIHNWVVGRKLSVSFGLNEEQTRVSTDDFIAKAFPSFATRFLDGAVHYSNKVPVVNFFRNTVTNREFKAEEFKQPGTHELDMTVLSWGIWETAVVSFPPKREVTFTWQPVVDKQDSVTVLMYRKSTEAVWRTAKRGEKVVVDSACSQYTFLGVSTRDTANVRKGFTITITFTVKKSKGKKAKRDDDDPIPAEDPPVNDPDAPTPEEPRDGLITTSVDNSGPDDDGDEGDSCSTNKCIVGNWDLDIPSMQSFLQQRLSGNAAATISNLVVSGSSSLIITQALSSTMTFKNLDIGYDGSASGFTFHTIIDLTGSVAGTVKLGDDAFTWIDPKSDGTVKTTTSLSGFDPIEIDYPVDKQYGPTTQVRYTCKDDKLQTEGYVDGKFTWAYSWTREAAA